MTFKETMIDFFKRYRDFSGRTSWKGFWYVFAVNFAIGLLTAIMIPVSKKLPFFLVFVLAGRLYGFLAALPSIAIAVRRLHDTGKSGFYYLKLVVIPSIIGLIINIITRFLSTNKLYNLIALIAALILLVSARLYLLYMLFKPSDGENEWGCPLD
ncbi:DUF805 domain-containing protein [bacterium]|nr:DUF805 domain-containing protein [bacterium]